MPVVGFWNGKSLKDYLVRTKLPKLEESGTCEPCGKKICLLKKKLTCYVYFYSMYLLFEFFVIFPLHLHKLMSISCNSFYFSSFSP